MVQQVHDSTVMLNFSVYSDIRKSCYEFDLSQKFRGYRGFWMRFEIYLEILVSEGESVTAKFKTIITLESDKAGRWRSLALMPVLSVT